ncbi:GNAT family N-acetyltransferase [Sphingomonas sp. PR090111-T3T-6A]|uniref:GNAT family N-acetyltransferase n=1 Tax=Sphingomonas sp. PR090111-T3T-6A TaxID=685778 RepID=UPI000379E255|nr:GNAT family protein [Sphingomonas sp. PR090111-T3T-6A]
MTADVDALRPAMADGALRLEPLAEAHRAGLAAACAADTTIWDIYPNDWSPAGFDANFEAVLAMPNRIVFAILHDGHVVGMSSYLNPSAVHGSAEIGGTYLAPDARGTGINARFKQLMLARAAACGFHRIEFRVDTRNTRSMAAVEKLGAVREGILRRHMVTWTGHVRDTALYALFIDNIDGPA